MKTLIDMRHKFKKLKALNYPIVTPKEIEEALKIDPKTERMEESPLAPCDYGNSLYAGQMPYGAMIAMAELIDGGVCELKDFVVFYPADINKTDPILCIRYPNMDKITRFSSRVIALDAEAVLFKIWQWE